jgi:hypothetical protein
MFVSSTPHNFPASNNVAAALVTIKLGDVRELHWHPNASELQFYLAGKGGMTIFMLPNSGRLWGLWMPDFMQFLAGIYLFTGLTWFNVFDDAAPLYMAALAFTSYGIHWFAMAHRKYIDSSAQPDGWMAIAFLFLSLLGVLAFGRAGDIP